MPRSSARWMVAIDSARSAGPYDWLMPMQPRPSADTARPPRPRVRVFMTASSSPGSPARQCVDPLDLVGLQREVQDGEVLPDPVAVGRLRDDDDAVLQVPAQHHLARLHAV